MLARPRVIGMAGAALLGLLALGGLMLRAPRLQPPARDVVLDGVTLLEPGEPARPNRRIQVRDGRIERIDAASADAAQGPYSGAFVLPGLIDLHVHHPPPWVPGERELFALLFLAHGVTSVRDTGSLFGSVTAQRRRIAAGELAGPRIFACGPWLDGDPPSWPGARALADPQEAEAAVAELAEAGVDCIKVYNGVSIPVYRAIHGAAERSGLRFVAHVPRSLPLDQMGRGEVQHLMGLTENWWEVRPERIAWYVAASRAQGMSHTPTLVAFARAMDLADYARRREDPQAALLPRYHREILWDPARNPLARTLSPADRGDLQRRLPVMQELVAELRGAGVPVLAGSDTGNPFVVPGASLLEELQRLSESGFSIDEVLAIATRGNAEVLPLPDLGRLREGAPADLLVLRDDPRRDLGALASLEAVVADGRLYPKPRLDEALRRLLVHLERPLPRAVSSTLARLALRAVSLRTAPGAETTTPRP